MNARILFLILIIQVLPHAAVSQKQGQALIDSLINELPHISNDTVKVKYLNKIGLYYVDVNIDSAFKYANMGMSIAEKMKWTRGISAFHTCIGNIFTNKGLLDSSLNRHKLALACSMKIHDSANEAVAYNNLGALANAKSDYVSAASYYEKALVIGEALKNDYNICDATVNLGLVYQYQHNYPKAFDYAKQALTAAWLSQEPATYASPLFLNGNLFLDTGNLDSAFYYFNKALVAAKASGNKIFEAASMDGISEYYANKGDNYKAIQLNLDAKKIWDSMDPNYEDAISNQGNLGKHYLQIAQSPINLELARLYHIPSNKDSLLNQASTHLENAINRSRDKGNKTAQSVFENYLAEVNVLTGHFKEAFFHYKNYKEIQDSIFSQANKNKIASLESQRAIDLKNKEIENKELQLGNQRKNMWLLLSLIGFLFAVGIIFYRQSIIRKRTNAKLMQLNMELAEANKVKAKFFGIISHDLRKPIANLANFLQLQKLKPGLFSEQQVVEREQKIKTATDALLETMEATLLWSKGQMENFKPEITEFRLSKLYSYLQKFFTDTEEVSFRFIGDENIILKSDEHYLRTIMQNLTANAIKALQQNPAAAIEWKAWQNGEKVFLSIEDNGTGASMEQLKALYDESAGMGGGNGLGLHIIRDLAKAIHCSVEMDASYQNGTRFLLSFGLNKNNMA